MAVCGIAIAFGLALNAILRTKAQATMTHKAAGSEPVGVTTSDDGGNW
jgi:hypothetical protein